MRWIPSATNCIHRNALPYLQSGSGSLVSACGFGGFSVEGDEDASSCLGLGADSEEEQPPPTSAKVIVQQASDLKSDIAPFISQAPSHLAMQSQICPLQMRRWSCTTPSHRNQQPLTRQNIHQPRRERLRRSHPLEL